MKIRSKRSLYRETSYIYVLVSNKSMEVDDGLLFFLGEVSPLDIRPEIVGPSEPATLSAPVQACKLGQSSPTPMPISFYVFHQLFILLRCPWPFLY